MKLYGLFKYFYRKGNCFEQLIFVSDSEKHLRECYEGERHSHAPLAESQDQLESFDDSETNHYYIYEIESKIVNNTENQNV